MLLLVDRLPTIVGCEKRPFILSFPYGRISVVTKKSKEIKYEF